MKKFVLLLLVASSVKSSAQTQQASGPVNVRDRNNVVIRDLVISNTGGNGIELWWCTNVLIENCTIKYTGGNGVNSFNSSNVTIRNCTFLENATAVYASTGSGIVVENCKFQNVNGPRPRGQFVQYNYITGGGNRISCNYMESIMGQGDPEDAISMHSSSGISGSPIMIENNYIKGGGPSSSGGGIALGDGGGSWLTARNNVLVDPGQYGMAIVSGSNNEISNNKIYGKKQYFSNAGIIIWEYDASVPCGSGHKVLNNKVNFTKYDGYSSSFWTDDQCGQTISGNQWASSEVSATMAPPSCAGLTSSSGGSSTPSEPDAPDATCSAGSLLVETFANIQGKTVPDLTNSSAYPNNPSSSLSLTKFEYGVAGEYFGRRTRGYICPPETGNYTFYFACDDAGELWLSTDANPSSKRKIAYLTSWVPPRVYNQYSTQKSAAISLTKGVKYYIEVVHQAGTGNDHMSVAWTLPSGITETPIPASRITGTVSSTSSSSTSSGSCTTGGTLWVETYANIPGKTMADLWASDIFPNNPTSAASMSKLEYGVAGEYFGRRVRGYICAPQSGGYTFSFACDDAGELWLSTDDNPANKRKIAYLTSWVPPKVYNQYSSQKSAVIQLTQGKRYYVEVLHKAGTGNDHMSVGWTLPNGVFESTIDDIAPYNSAIGVNAATSSSSTLQVTTESTANSPAELKAGLSVKATPNPSQSAFNIQIQSGKEAATFIRVTDLMGRLIEQRKDIQNAKNIQIGQNWAKGIYILELTQGDQRRILKLMKE